MPMTVHQLALVLLIVILIVLVLLLGGKGMY